MKRNRQSLSIALSLILHGVLALLLIFAPSLQKRPPARKQTEVELVDPEKLLAALKQQREQAAKGQIVEQDENQLNDEKPEDAKFLSRHNQKVVKQTQAAVHGKFRNTDGSSGAKKTKREAGKVDEKSGKEADQDVKVADKTDDPRPQKNVVTAKDGMQAKSKPEMKDLMPSFKPVPPPIDSDKIAEGGGEGPSATDDSLKDVATGMQTLLSTREFVYYSYYNRIKDKLRQYWEPKIKEKMERIVRQGRRIASNTDRITRIVIILDDTGTLVRVQIVGASGVNDLDDAAVEAFRAAAPFPNPPKGIVDPDGTIKIRWDFILEANNSNSLLNAVRMAKVKSG